VTLRRAALFVPLVLLAACAPDAQAVALLPGSSFTYRQMFQLAERRSGDEELPSLSVMQEVTVTSGPTREGSTALEIDYGDVDVWLGEERGEPTFSARDADAVQRAFDGPESGLGGLYAALWAATAHCAVTAWVDRRAVLHDVRGVDGIRERRGDATAEDVTGAMLESALADPSFLFLAHDGRGTHPIGFDLAHWNGALALASRLDERESRFQLQHAAAAVPTTGATPVDVTVRVRGSGDREPGSGMLLGVTMRFEIEAAVPTGAGPPRRDSAILSYTLSRAR